MEPEFAETGASVNSATGADRALPDPEAGDRANIDRFLAANRGKPVVVVQGLGFVGAVMSLVCANAYTCEYAVLGVDLPTDDALRRIQSLNDGIFPITAEDPAIDEFFERAREKGNFYATHDAYAYSVADIIIVDVNLDVGKLPPNGDGPPIYEVDLSGFRGAIETIGRNCREDVLVLVETTVPPGTCQKLVKPVLDETLKARGLSTARYRLGHSYERVMPGPDYIDSIRTFPRVYAGIDEPSAEATKAFLQTIIDTERCPLTRLASTNATEMAKVLENAYRAMNIGFVVEWSRFAEEAGVNLYEVVSAIRQRPTHANLMLPGIGVGGYCLTKDPLLASWARQEFFGGEALAQSERSVATNDRMPDFAFDFLRKSHGDLSGARVLLLGVSYRGEVGDTRFTPVAPFYDRLIEAGADVALHDPYVDHWREKSLAVPQDLAAALRTAPDIVVISTGHSLYKRAEALDALMELEGLLIYDTIGIYSPEQIARLSQKHRVKVLGRGDL